MRSRLNDPLLIARSSNCNARYSGWPFRFIQGIAVAVRYRETLTDIFRLPQSPDEI